MSKKKIWIGLMLLVLGACKRDFSPLIQQKVAENVESLRQKKAKACRQELLEIAEKTVDSLLLEEAELASIDSFNRLKPQKPAHPRPIPPIDSARVEPIFK